MSKQFSCFQNSGDSLLLSLEKVALIRAELIGCPVVAKWNVRTRPAPPDVFEEFRKIFPDLQTSKNLSTSG